jgi:hypothetical protein
MYLLCENFRIIKYMVHIVWKYLTFKGRMSDICVSTPTPLTAERQIYLTSCSRYIGLNAKKSLAGRGTAGI